jgi:D-3-phosphoglycerate dehydrogenase
LKILIGTSSFGLADDAPLRTLAAAGIDVVMNPYGRKINDAELPALLTDDIVGLIAGLETLSRPMLSTSSVRVISRVGAGMSNVDLPAAHDLGILVYSTPDAPTQAVAELTLGAMLSLLREIPAMDRDLHAGSWVKRLGRQLDQRTVAIVGFGRVGRRVAALLAPFGTRVVVVAPSMEEANVDGLPVLTLEDALAQADIVTVHASGEEPILDEHAFALMHEGTLILNAARGGCVSEPALIAALDAGRVAGAWIDTFETEPYAGPLTAYDNVLLTPHVGSNTVECRVEMERDAVDHLLMGLAKAGLR